MHWLRIDRYFKGPREAPEDLLARAGLGRTDEQRMAELHQRRALVEAERQAHAGRQGRAVLGAQTVAQRSDCEL